MLIFIDESWQTISGATVATLGAVAVPTASYDRLCTQFFAMKHRVLGAQELADKEIKAGVNLTRAQFKRLTASGRSAKLEAVMQTFAIFERFGARTFAVSSTAQDDLALRCTSTVALATPYAELLHDLKRMMRQDCRDAKGQLYFDQRSHSEDLNMACAVQNFIMRRHPSWSQHFLQVPHFTLSPVSPGLQAADLVAYLAGQQVDPTNRPELAPYYARVERLEFQHRARRPRRALRLVA